MRTLICGSLAYDTIMVFQDQFKNHILPDKIHTLSVSFYVPEMRRECGGTAGNIAYNMQLLDGEPLIMATLGEDFASYTKWLDSNKLDSTHIKTIPSTFTAQAFITTDTDDNQITAFHPGAMNESHRTRVDEVADIGLGIIAPDGKAGMQQHAAQFAELGIPFMFDPGQGLTLFSGPELAALIGQARYVAVNDYEAKLLSERTGWSMSDIATRVDALIITLGAEGSVIHANGETYAISAVRPTAIVDPTGCGDAYRAGLLYGIAHDWDWEATGNLASVMGSIKIASRGGQNHRVERAEVAEHYRKAFGERPW